MNDETRVEIPCIGERFPHLDVLTTMGNITLPDHFQGKWFLLFSHPADFTPVCTTEFASFAINHQRFRELGCELIGLSVDQVYSHIKWVEWMEENLKVVIEYPIIADSNGDIARVLGTVHPPTARSAIRGVYIVDPDAVIQAILYYPRGVGRNMEELLRIIRAARIARERSVAIPANWPHNEFIGEEVLLPPPKDVAGAKERRGKQGCLDWWFCSEKL